VADGQAICSSCAERTMQTPSMRARSRKITDHLYTAEGLTIDASGNLYGTTYQGGKYNYGSVFQVVP